MLRRAANSLLGTSRQEAPVEEALSETALLRQWQQGVDCATMQAFVGSSELPTGAESERESLLLRYIRAEKLSLAKAAQRLEQQAAWRLGFGAVGEVRPRGRWREAGDSGGTGPRLQRISASQP